jgi:hypothetical protein
MAVRAVVDAAPPEWGEAVDSRQLVHHSGGEQHPAALGLLAVGCGRSKAGLIRDDVSDLRLPDRDTGIPIELGSAGSTHFGGIGAIARQEPVHGRRAAVAWMTAVDQQHRAPDPPEHQSSVQPGWPAPDDQDVEHLSLLLTDWSH